MITLADLREAYERILEETKLPEVDETELKRERRKLTEWLNMYARPASIDDWRRFLLSAANRGYRPTHAYDYPFSRWNRNNPFVEWRPPYRAWVVYRQPPQDNKVVPKAYGANAVTLLVEDGIDIQTSGHNSAIFADGRTENYPVLALFSDL